MLREAPVMGFLAAVDAARAEAFYDRVLVLERIEDRAAAPVPKANRTERRLQERARHTPHSFTVFGWVDEPTAAISALAAKAIALERFGLPGQGADGIWTVPGGARIAWFKDPDRSLLSLTEPGRNL